MVCNVNLLSLGSVIPLTIQGRLDHVCVVPLVDHDVDVELACEGLDFEVVAEGAGLSHSAESVLIRLVDFGIGRERGIGGVLSRCTASGGTSRRGDLNEAFEVVGVVS